MVDVVITHWPTTMHATPPRLEHSVNTTYYVNYSEGLVVDIGAQLRISGHFHGRVTAFSGLRGASPIRAAIRGGCRNRTGYGQPGWSRFSPTSLN